MQDRRHAIIEAGIATLREDGYAGFTQPRIAARAGLRQSHLTYYFPTRADLLAAVAEGAIGGLLAAVDAVFTSASAATLPHAIARIAARHENTRVIVALAQAADQEPRVRALFRDLADGIVARASRFLQARTPASTENDARLLHVLAVGLAVVELAAAWPDGEQRMVSVLETALSMITGR